MCAIAGGGKIRTGKMNMNRESPVELSIPCRPFAKSWAIEGLVHKSEPSIFVLKSKCSIKNEPYPGWCGSKF
jgi:hypothetical protein